MVRAAFASALFALLAVVSAARAETPPASTGTRIEIAMPAGTKAPNASELVKTLLPPAEGRSKQPVRVQVVNEQDEGEKVRLEIWGQLAGGDLIGTLRAAHPSLKDAKISVFNLTGPAPSMSKLSGVNLEGDLSDPAAVAALKEELLKRLHAEGKEGTVEVQIEHGEPGTGARKVEVKVLAK